MYCVNEMLFASLMSKYISAWKFVEGILVMRKEELHIHKYIFACLFSIHNTISLSCHEQLFLSGQWATFQEILLPSLGPMMGEVSLKT